MNKNKSLISTLEEKLSSLLTWASNKKNFRQVVTTLLILGLCARVPAPFYRQEILYGGGDAANYLNKAREILEGDITPPRESNIGWPLLTAAALKLFGAGNLIEEIFIINLLSALTGSLILIPLILLAAELFDRKTALIAALFFVFDARLIDNAGKVLTEAPYTLLLLYSMYFLVRGLTDNRAIAYSAIFAALSYLFRANAVVLVPVIWVYLFVNRRRLGWWIVYVPIIFLIFSAPKLGLRAYAFGDPFDYGANSQYFLDGYDQVWDRSLPYWTEGHKVTLGEYLRTHNILQIFGRVVLGFLIIVSGMIYVLNPVVIALAFMGFLFYTSRLHLLFHINYVIVLLTGFWVYYIYHDPRHFIPLIPYAIVLASAALRMLLRQSKYPMVFTASVVFFHWIVWVGYVMKYAGII